MDAPTLEGEWPVHAAVPRPGRSVATAVGAFLLAGAVAVSVIAAVTVLLWRHQTEQEAIQQARNVTNIEARDVIGPALTDAALVPGSKAQQSLDVLVRTRVVHDNVVRVKIWAADGTILYSDDAALIGSKFAEADDVQHALATTRTFAEISNLQSPENRDERSFGKLLEVYLGVRTPSGRRVLFETYQRYDVIAASAHRVWGRSMPALLLGLLLLYVVQAPLAYRLAMRLRRAQQDREQALLDALSASDRERRRIAADLHDGVVQGLAGVSYTLSAAADRAEAAKDNRTAAVVRRASQDLRSWVRELRSLVVTIAPPKLHEAGLSAALHDLRGTLTGRGIDVTTDLAPLPKLHPEVETLAFRVAQEAVRNVVKHSDAQSVTLRADLDGDVLLVEVVDDGRGLADAAERPTEGGHGLALLGDLTRAQGGDLTLSTPDGGSGTAVRLVVPAQTRSEI